LAKVKSEQQKLLKKVKKSEQIISMVMGILVVLAIGGLAYRYFQTSGLPFKMDKEKQEQVEDNGEEQEITEEKKELPVTHTVDQGESLWEIAEKYYLSGYNWIDIAEANNLSNPDILEPGQELTIPDSERKTITVTELPETGIVEDIEIEGDTYTVTEGDSLSKIAIRAYGDMFDWTKIWSANRDQISNPNIIEPGMELKIPRG
jgi:nucleoid-associated protein YgaU